MYKPKESKPREQPPSESVSLVQPGGHLRAFGPLLDAPASRSVLPQAWEMGLSTSIPARRWQVRLLPRLPPACRGHVAQHINVTAKPLAFPVPVTYSASLGLREANGVGAHSKDTQQNKK